ncbi:MAG: winged helix-turn-helix domain-containing protein [Pseudomonadota bacterium]
MLSTFRFERFELRPAQRALMRDGEPVRLGGRAFDILLVLVERRDRVVDVDELLDTVWPGLAVEENNLSVQISALRKLLGPVAITTVRGRGYRFTARTREFPPEAAASADARQAALWHQRGAVVAIRPAGTGGPLFDDGFGAEALAGSGGRVISRADGGLSIAFDHAEDAARAALKIQRQAARHDEGSHAPARSLPCIGLVAAGGAKAHDDDPREAESLARALAALAHEGEIVTTTDLVGEFVAGVDGDIEDLDDVVLACGPVRAYRIRPSARPASYAVVGGLGQVDLKPSIMVLPFESVLPADPKDMLGEALADDVITVLSQSVDFSVISGLSSRRLRRCGLPPADLGACLAASFLLTGSYKPTSAGISLTVHLQDARRGTVLRSICVDAGMREAFGTVDSLGTRIAQEVGQALFQHAVQESRSRPLPELESYALLMGAISLMHRAALREFDRARAMLEHLMQRHACGGVAAAWLAKWHVLRVVQGWSPEPSADARLALDYVAQSLEEDSRDALALSIGGLVHAYLRKDLNMAGQLYEQAIEANPSEPLAWLFSATRHAYLGMGSEAEQAGERALRLSPIDPLKYFFDSLVATAALANSSWERSVALSQRSLKANRTHASTWRTLAIALVMMNRVDEAREAVQRLLAIEPGLTVGGFKERFPGRDGPLAGPFAEALKTAGVPD